VIEEDLETLKNRVISRGGKVTDTIERRARRMRTLKGKAKFSGTSDQVAHYLK
jgi:hypothetical protein